MFHIRDEGGVVKTGFNFYPLTSNQIGFVFRLGSKKICIRYSKQIRKFVVS